MSGLRFASDNASLAIAVSLALFAWLAVFAWRRENKHRLWLRLLATALVISSATAAFLKPQRLASYQTATGVLLTSGVTQNDVQQLTDELHPAYRFEINRDGVAAIDPMVIAVPDAAFIRRHYPDVKTLHVLGEGLSKAEWQGMDSVFIQPHTVASNGGVQFLSYPRFLSLGKALRVTGVASGNGWLVFSGTTGAMDSVHLATATQPFDFKTTPQASGRFEYFLTMKNDAGHLKTRDTLGVWVQPPKPQQLFILNESPNFEFKYLKNWAASGQSKIMARTRISKERYRSETLNAFDETFARTLEKDLKNIGVLVTDDASIAALREDERRRLREAIEQNGLGVYIRLTNAALNQTTMSAADREFFFANVSITKSETTDEPATPLWAGLRASQPLQVLSVTLPVRFSSQAIVTDEKKKTLVMLYQKGLGRVAVSAMDESYRWLLEGKKEIYAAYWSFVLESVARTDEEESWQMQPLSFTDEPVTLNLTTTDERPTATVQSGQTQTPIALRQDEANPQQWSGTVWPRNRGWHSVRTASGGETWFYVNDRTAWQTWQAEKKIEDTKQAAQNSLEFSDAKQAVVFRYEPISSVWFFLLFIAGCGFLWIEKKL
jgi:hypothetical protein